LAGYAVEYKLGSSSPRTAADTYLALTEKDRKKDKERSGKKKKNAKKGRK
jgi:hypothetical protein